MKYALPNGIGDTLDSWQKSIAKISENSAEVPRKVFSDTPCDGLINSRRKKILWPSPEDVEEHTFPLPVGADEAASLTLLLMTECRFAPFKKRYG